MQFNVTGKRTKLSDSNMVLEPDVDPNPLSSKQLDDCQKTSRQLRKRESDFLYNIVPYTGLTASEFVHLSSNWITWPDKNSHLKNSVDIPVISIPENDICSYTRWNPLPPASISKEGPCGECRRFRSSDKWQPSAANQVRHIPVHEPRAQQALHRYFKTFDFEANPWGPDHRKDVVKRVDELVPLSRSVTYRDLIYTFIHICAEGTARLRLN